MGRLLDFAQELYFSTFRFSDYNKNPPFIAELAGEELHR
jgi:hypothetical protein